MISKNHSINLKKRKLLFNSSLFCLLLTFFFSQNLFAQTTWTGATDNQWTTASNWNTNAVPTINDNVILAVAVELPQIGAGLSAQAKSIIIDAGQDLNMQPNATLDIGAAAGHGIIVNGSATFSGTVTIGSFGAIGQSGIRNNGTIANIGDLYINDVTNNGIENSTGNTFNNLGSIFIGTIQPIGIDGIVNFGTFNNEFNIQIMDTGASGIFNSSSGIFNHTGGSIQVDKTVQNGIYSNGIFNNSASLVFGAHEKINRNGIQNLATFNNLAGGNIQIDDTGLSAIFNQNGTFDNHGTMTFGVNKKIGLDGIRNGATFNNYNSIVSEETTNAGIATFNIFLNTSTIQIALNKPAGREGIYNSGTFDNQGGSIQIDNCGKEGISNPGTFNNTSSASIQIDKTTQAGIANFGSASFNNDNSTIVLGLNKSIGHSGFYNQGIINNLAGGNIQIEETGFDGIDQQPTGTLNNHGSMTFGANKKIGRDGIHNSGIFNNYNSIMCEETTRHGIFLTNNSTFNNSSTISIGLNKKIGEDGIDLKDNSVFHNTSGGVIQIDETGRDGIALVNSSVFNNSSTISLGLNKINGRDGIIVFDVSIFNNTSGGAIQIEETGNSGIRNQSTFNNSASIIIGSIKRVAGIGILNFRIFNNTGGGDIKVYNAGINSHAIRNESAAASFTNEADIFTAGNIYNNVGADFLNTKNITVNTSSQPVNTFLNQDGIHSVGTFTNQADGYIQIDFPWGNGIWNRNADFQNFGKIHIGLNGTTGLSGMLNRSPFVNHVGSELLIDNSRQQGLVNDGAAATFTNNSLVGVGPPNIATNATVNNSGTLLNNACAVFDMEGLLNNSGSLTNSGWFFINSLLAHLNTGTFTNNGFIEYPQGNPVPDVINNEIILAPATIDGCRVLAPPFDVGGGNGFSVLGIYTDPAATTSAGTYDMATNSFTANNSLPAGSYLLYIQIEDTNGGCTRINTWGVDVLPYAEPATAVFNVPATVSCSTADGYIPPNATYDNGVVGVSNISGEIVGISPTTNTWSACGGFFTVTYPDVIDVCGRTIMGAVFTINVEPAPQPTIAMPTLPTSVSCMEAENYMPPTTTYSNGLTGRCEISGTASVGVNHFFDECGGTLEIVYTATDACGYHLTPNITTINVDPAPAPTLSVPTFPSMLTCAEAESFVVPFADYSNGLTGACEISGSLPAQVVKNVDACNGGTVTISYGGIDGCGNQLSAEPIVISVAPASLATLILPYNPNAIFCWEAANYDHGNAVYDNGESGFCSNSGEIAPTYQHFWDNCEGGYIVINYSGYDDCGNALESDIFKVAVLPDTWAPQGTCVSIEQTISELKLIPPAHDIEDYKNQIASNYSDYCGYVVTTLVGDTGIPECQLDGTFERIYSIEVADECGNVADTCSIIFSGKCNPLYCNMSQDFYSTPDVSYGSYTSSEMIDILIDGGANPIIIGDGSCGLTLDNVDCIQAALVGEGQPVSLSNGYNLSCGSPLNNTLVNQVITTVLNIRYNAMLNSGGLDYGNFHIDAACLSLSYAIRSALPEYATVNDLVAYANDYIACQCDNTCGNFSNINVSLTSNLIQLNNRFDNCYVPGPCPIINSTTTIEHGIITENHPTNITPADETTTSNSEVDKNDVLLLDFKLYPNPTNNILNLDVKGLLGKSGFVEIFDTHGRKIGEKSLARANQNILQLEVQNFADGLYWLSVTIDGQRMATKKFVVKK